MKKLYADLTIFAHFPCLLLHLLFKIQISMWQGTTNNMIKRNVIWLAIAHDDLIPRSFKYWSLLSHDIWSSSHSYWDLKGAVINRKVNNKKLNWVRKSLMIGGINAPISGIRIINCIDSMAIHSCCIEL